MLVPTDLLDQHNGYDDFAWDGDDQLPVDPWRQRQNVRLALLTIADGLGDAEAYLAEYRGRPRLVARMARRLTAGGQPERALALLEAMKLPEGLERLSLPHLRAYGHLMGFLKKLNVEALLLPE